MSFYPVTLQVQSETDETWTDVNTLHALKINRAGGGDESSSAGADQYHFRLKFEFRWRKALETAGRNPQIYRLVYRGMTYNIVDYDDYMESHRTVRLVGEAYGPQA